jgi:hypothetical protein
MPRLLGRLSVLLVLAAGTLHAGDGRLVATVQGRPRVQAAAASGGGLYADRQLQYTPRFDYQHLKNAVVYAVPDGGTAARSSASDVLTVRRRREALALSPDFILISGTAPLHISNETSESVHLYAVGGSADRWEETIPARGSLDSALPSSGHYRLACLEDSDARSRVFAAEGYAAAADADGRFQLTLPPGRYHVTAWHDRLPSETKDVDIHSGETRTVSFTLSVQGLPEIQ